MLQLKVILLTGAIFAFCEPAAILDKINKKCSISDDDCVRILYKSILQEIADNGIPEFDVPKGDPLVLKNTSVTVLGMIKMTMKEGEAKGFKSCEINNFKIDLSTQRHTVDFICERLTIEGNYKIESTPTLLALVGGIDIHGEGNGGIVIEQATMSFDFALEIKKLDDGEIHILINPDDTTNTFEVKGKATLHADNILVGKQEISAVLVNIFNENWNFLTNHFGKTIVDSTVGLFMDHAQVFFSKVPAKEFITDDLSSYVKS